MLTGAVCVCYGYSDDTAAADGDTFAATSANLSGHNYTSADGAKYVPQSGSGGSSDDSWLYGLVIVAVLVLAALAILYCRRRRGPAQP